MEAPAIVWKSLDFMGLSKYEISNTGLLRTKASGYTTPGSRGSHGYYSSSPPHDDGKTRKVYIHVLVTSAFRGPKPSPGHTVDHIDRNPGNNHESNLRWATKREQGLNQGPRKIKYGRPVTRTKANGVQFTWFKVRYICEDKGLGKRALKTALDRGTVLKNSTWAYCYDMISGEEWRCLPSHILGNEIYVSNMGRVWHGDRMNYGSTSAEGRKTFAVTDKKGNQTPHFVHRIVMLAFIGDAGDLQVNHKDGNPKNNRLSNLEYVTASENSQHAVDTGLRVMQIEGHRQGMPVIQMTLEGIEIARFCSTREAHRKTGIASATISRVCNGGGKTAGGFKWKYVHGGGYDHLLQK